MRTARPSPPFADAIRRVERTWLGLVTPPLDEWLEEEGWSPDDPARVCPRCGGAAGEHEADAAGCTACRARRIPWDRLVRTGDYTGVLRDAVHEVKFSQWRRVGDRLGAMLGRAILDAARDAGADLRRAALVPVPTTFRRRMARGIDHALVISRGVRRATGIPIVHALERSHRPSQLAVSPGQRARNVSGSFRARLGLPHRPPLVIIVDDVTTTGATLAACTRAVLRGWPRTEGSPTSAAGIWTAVVAVTPSPLRRPNSSDAPAATRAS